MWLSGVALIAALASCSSAAGNAETDRVAGTVATAIGSPRQESADGLVRAALATAAGRDARLRVVAADALSAAKPADPRARLVFRVHLAGSRGGFGTSDPITACYVARFSFYGVIGSPRRIACPEGARAIVPAALPAKPRRTIPAGLDATLSNVLGALPVSPTSDDVRARVASALPAPIVDAHTGLQDLPPTVATALSGADVGVALWEPEDRGCLLGARIGGHVTVGRPSRVQLQPGELSCDAETALQLRRLRPPD
ncbi:MAG: hypothetical protein QOJ35_2721 [Solirubrobacteraceae bacterium]|nr:hypothetical protein [Solirubrobacteraceae bacterium]